jgi:hypothetical protein
MADQSPELLSAEEVERWADILVDEFVNPKSLLRALLLEGSRRPDFMRAVTPLVRTTLGLDRPLKRKLVPALRELVLRGDRKLLRKVFIRMLRVMPRATFELVRTRISRAHLRKILLAQANQFKGKQGPQPKPSMSSHRELVSRADSLYPVLLWVLRELEHGTKHSVAKMLDFLLPDYESPVTYIRRHILKLEEDLGNPPKRLKDAKRIETRAKLLAAGLAGCDDGYAFNTSVEKVRQGRRRAASRVPIDSPRKK